MYMKIASMIKAGANLALSDAFISVLLVSGSALFLANCRDNRIKLKKTAKLPITIGKKEGSKRLSTIGLPKLMAVTK